MKRLTVTNHDKTYRCPLIVKGIDFRVLDQALFGEPIDKLGRYEDLGYEPEELAEVVRRYKQHEGIYSKITTE